MMHVVAFQEFAKKRKNYPPKGLTEPQATTEWHRLCDLPNAITDEDGPYVSPTEDFRLRVAVATSTTVINRQAVIQGQGSNPSCCSIGVYIWEIIS